ncbi:recombinase RecA [Secundilactobacillus folii]|uniref:Protein RecA n=1 Tax=Secundilactobacillus folii TaxID=2678357 RepID=A0A7X2XTW8_9LACO|nr:recombinase RecA [Secundilactobacillus folii]MTV81608.1 recombinase RecA [Secundilactobacillus folii]
MALHLFDPDDPTQKNDDKQRKQALDHAMHDIEKKFGKGALMRMGDKPNLEIERFSSGLLSLDHALGGGYPRGRIMEIYGPESSGKTTLALTAVASLQKEGGIVAYIDAENALDATYAKALGVNLDQLLLSQPGSAEEGFQIAHDLVQSGAIDMVVFDSVAAMVPKAEIDGEIGDNHVGLQARLMSQSLRALAGMANQTQTTLLFINQIREKIGVMFGNPEVTPGGRALKFYATVRLDIRKRENIKEGTDIIGTNVKIKVTKNKVAPPLKQIEVQNLFGHGLSRAGDILNLAVDNDVIQKSGSWYSYNGERMGQGQTNALDYLEQHTDVQDEIADKIKAIWDGDKGDSPSDGKDSEVS